MGLDRITNFNIARRDQNPRHPPCFSRERSRACYNVINLISRNGDEAVNRKVVAIPKPGRAEECGQGSAHAPGARSCLRRDRGRSLWSCARRVAVGAVTPLHVCRRGGVQVVYGAEACRLCSQHLRSSGHRCPSAPLESTWNCSRDYSH